MATNCKQDQGDVMTFLAPAGGVVSGTPLMIGAAFVVPLVTTTVGLPFAGKMNGVWVLNKTSAQAWTEGQRIYWDATNARADNTSTVGMFIGVASAVAVNPSSTGLVRLNATAPEFAESSLAAITLLTDSSGGTPSDTLADVPAAYTEATLANQIASLAAKINAILNATR